MPPPAAFVFRAVSDHALGRQHQARDRRCVLQSRARDFSGIEDAQFEHVAIGVVSRVEAKVAFACQHFVDHHAGSPPALATISRRGASIALSTKFDTGFLVSVVTGDVARSLACAQQGDTAASNDTFFHRSARRVQGVFDAGFLLFHFDFGSGANFDHSNTASQFGDALLQFFFVVVAGRFFDLLANLSTRDLRYQQQRQRRR
jgi:hypothetical protein